MKGQVVVLTGGVGGAKLVLGLTQIIAAEQVVAIVNTGDDFTHLGLKISPDLDTLLYTLAGKANREQGWGREGETWEFMEALRSLGGEGWFNLGDGDLALHVLRTAALAEGRTLTGICADFTWCWDISAKILPMSNDPIATRIMTDIGELAFQRYFVEHRCQPVATSIRFEGASEARPAPGVIEAILDPDTSAILIAPSNPYLSIDPILAIPAIRSALGAAKAPVVAVSPVIAGRAVKGPTAKLMNELDVAIVPNSIARHYSGVIDAILIDRQDADDTYDIETASENILMENFADRARVASACLALAHRIRR